MSTVLLDIYRDAALAFGDPQYRRVTRADWVHYINVVQARIANELMCLETEATFDINADQFSYGYPPDMVQVRSLWRNDTPSTTPNDWIKLKEIMKDEFERETDRVFPTGDPERYYAQPGRYFSLVPCPATTVPGGGLMVYARTTTPIAHGTPGNVTAIDDNVQGQIVIELPDWLRFHLLDGVVILAHRKVREYEEAAQKEAVWLREQSRLADKMEDVSRDRRPAIRPKSLVRPYGDQT